jgi:hypothetical protein
MAKIALLFSGLPRQWQHCAESQHRLFRDNPTDVFFHFWDTVDDAEKSRIVEAYRPKTHQFEKPADFTAQERQIKLLDRINTPARALSQYYSWRAVARLFEAHCAQTGDRYDFAVRIRADLLFTCALDKILPVIQQNQIFLSNLNNFGMINDTFALGPVAPILYFLSIYDHIMEYTKTIQFNPEMLLIEHLRRRSDIKLLSAPFPFLVFRPHMVGRPINECMKENPGWNKWEDPEIVRDHLAGSARTGSAQRVAMVQSFIGDRLKDLQRQRQQPPAAGGSPGVSRPRA